MNIIEKIKNLAKSIPFYDKSKMPKAYYYDWMRMDNPRYNRCSNEKIDKIFGDVSELKLYASAFMFLTYSARGYELLKLENAEDVQRVSRKCAQIVFQNYGEIEGVKTRQTS